jgi:hypothetical protein
LSIKITPPQNSLPHITAKGNLNREKEKLILNILDKGTGSARMRAGKRND